MGERSETSAGAIKRLIDEVLRRLPREECRTCDCFQGFVTQLNLDAQDDVSDITAPLEVPKNKMHGCLGCNPCPPAEAFSDYIRQRKETKS